MRTDKTNAVRLLDKEKIAYKLITYQVDESDLSAIHVAEQLNEPIEQVFKTLILKGDKTGYFVCIIPGAKGLKLRAQKEQNNRKQADKTAQRPYAAQ